MADPETARISLVGKGVVGYIEEVQESPGPSRGTDSETAEHRRKTCLSSRRQTAVKRPRRTLADLLKGADLHSTAPDSVGDLVVGNLNKMPRRTGVPRVVAAMYKANLKWVNQREIRPGNGGTSSEG